MSQSGPTHTDQGPKGRLPGRPFASRLVRGWRKRTSRALADMMACDPRQHPPKAGLSRLQNESVRATISISGVVIDHGQSDCLKFANCAGATTRGARFNGVRRWRNLDSWPLHFHFCSPVRQPQRPTLLTTEHIRCGTAITIIPNGARAGLTLALTSPAARTIRSRMPCVGATARDISITRPGGAVSMGMAAIPATSSATVLIRAGGEPSFRAGARPSGLNASHRPGMTIGKLSRAAPNSQASFPGCGANRASGALLIRGPQSVPDLRRRHFMPRRVRDTRLPSRQKSNFASPINAESTVHSLAKKYFALLVGQIIARESRHPAPATRGVSRSSRTLARDAMDAFASTDERCRKRTAKPRGLSASTLARTWR